MRLFQLSIAALALILCAGCGSNENQSKADSADSSKLQALSMMPELVLYSGRSESLASGVIKMFEEQLVSSR